MAQADTAFTPDVAERRRWMSVLARAEMRELENVWTGIEARPAYEFLRRPETGLVMVRARAGGVGASFNLGEMSVTRCSVVLDDGVVGHGYVAGTNLRHAELAAVFDGLMQHSNRLAVLEAKLVGPVYARLAAKRREEAAKVAATKVDFFTLVRGESV